MEPADGKVLITGATGFIGRLLTRRLLADGYAVRCMVRKGVDGIPAGAETVQADMLQPLTLGAAL
jgi:uncharacterized protein YbjT (DUF2867 family)